MSGAGEAPFGGLTLGLAGVEVDAGEIRMVGGVGSALAFDGEAVAAGAVVADLDAGFGGGHRQGHAGFAGQGQGFGQGAPVGGEAEAGVERRRVRRDRAGGAEVAGGALAVADIAGGGEGVGGGQVAICGDVQGVAGPVGRAVEVPAAMVGGVEQRRLVGGRRDVQAQGGAVQRVSGNDRPRARASACAVGQGEVQGCLGFGRLAEGPDVQVGACVARVQRVLAVLVGFEGVKLACNGAAALLRRFATGAMSEPLWRRSPS